MSFRNKVQSSVNCVINLLWEYCRWQFNLVKNIIASLNQCNVPRESKPGSASRMKACSGPELTHGILQPMGSIESIRPLNSGGP